MGGASFDLGNQLTKWTSQKEVDYLQKTMKCFPHCMLRIEVAKYTYTWKEIYHLLSPEGWAEAQEKVRLIARRINGEEGDERARPDNERLLRHLTTNTLA